MVNICWLCKECDYKGTKYTFHRFPSNPQKRLLWLKQLNRSDCVLPKSARLCSKHFKESNYQLTGGKTRLLKHDAFPFSLEVPSCKRQLELKSCVPESAFKKAKNVINGNNELNSNSITTENCKVVNTNKDETQYRQKPENTEKILAKENTEMQCMKSFYNTENNKAQEQIFIKEEVLDANEMKYEFVDDIVKEESIDNYDSIDIKSEFQNTFLNETDNNKEPESRGIQEITSSTSSESDTESVLSTSTTSSSLSPDILSAETRNIILKKRGKTYRYIGDIDIKDVTSLETAKRCFIKVRSVAMNQRKEIYKLKRNQKNLTKRVEDLKSLVKHLQNQIKISEGAKCVLKVNRRK